MFIIRRASKLNHFNILLIVFGCQKWFPDFGLFQLKFCVHLFHCACYMSQQFNYSDNNAKSATSEALGCATVPFLVTSSLLDTNIHLNAILSNILKQ